MKLLIDMNLSPRWCAFLSRRNIPAVHWSSVGPATATDSEILAYAHRHSCVLLTADVNLAALAELTRRSAISVVQIGAPDLTPDLTPDLIGDEVVRSLRLLERQLLAGALVQVKPRGAASPVPSRQDAPDTRRQSMPSPTARALVTGGMPGAQNRFLGRAGQRIQA